MQSEVNFLGRLSHPNLVKLLGYCWEDKELLLVYDFMQKGSLENHLFRSKNFFQKQPHTKKNKKSLHLPNLAYLCMQEVLPLNHCHGIQDSK